MTRRKGETQLQTRSSYKIAIIGAGIRGLVSAACLKRLGHRVTVFESQPQIGGIWQRAFVTSAINTPRYGYSFDPSNLWAQKEPGRAAVLENLARLVALEDLTPLIKTNTPITEAKRGADGQWDLTGTRERFDAVLVATGHLGTPKQPDPAKTHEFAGQILAPYDFDPKALEGKNIVVVGSGATSLEMLRTAQTAQSRTATLLTLPGTQLRNCNWREDAKFWVASNPWLYAMSKNASAERTPTAVLRRLDRILAAPKTQVVQGLFSHAQGLEIQLTDRTILPADVIIWCTGWHNPTPEFVHQNRHHPDFMAAMCPACLDTKGFGFGSSSIYAKLLDRILIHDLKAPFLPETYGCDCHGEKETPGRHILRAARAYLRAQPGGPAILRQMQRKGLSENLTRLRRAREPLWISLLAFLNAPFGQ